VAVRGPSIPDVGQRRALVWEEERIPEGLEGHRSVLVISQVATLTLISSIRLWLGEISGCFLKSVELADSRPSYIQARKGAYNWYDRRKIRCYSLY
jgi:hypothetical protein